MAISLQAPSVEGVSTITASELNKVLVGKSVAVTPFADRLYHGMTAVCTPSDIETALQIFYAAHTAPRCDSVGSTIAKQRELQVFGNRDNSPFTAYQDTVNAILYGNHYAVRSATLSELKEWNHGARGYLFYRRLFRKCLKNQETVHAKTAKSILSIICAFCALPSRFLREPPFA